MPDIVINAPRLPKPDASYAVELYGGSGKYASPGLVTLDEAQAIVRQRWGRREQDEGRIVRVVNDGGVYDGPAEHRELLLTDPILRACCDAGLSRDQTIAELAKDRALLADELARVRTGQPMPVAIIVDGSKS